MGVGDPVGEQAVMVRQGLEQDNSQSSGFRVLRGRREGQGGERGKSWRAWWAVGEDLGLYPEGSRIPGVL